MLRSLLRVPLRPLAICLISCLITASAQAGKYNRVLDIGDDGPAWEELIDADGESVQLERFADSKAIVLLFTCNECPVAQAYEKRLVKLAKEAEEQGVTLVAINANKGEEMAAMKKHAAERGFSFPYLRDASQKTAKAYGAVCTPHAFLLDQNRKVAYMGAIDDSWINAEEVEKDYLRDAIRAVIAGETPAMPESKQVGCAIRWAR